MTAALGVDVGGTGTKGAIVDIGTGELLTERHRVPTPKPAAPERVVDAVLELAAAVDWSTRFGCVIPAVVRNGVARSAANIDEGWIGFDASGTLTARHGQTVRVFNDADAAGVAEMTLGAGRDVDGVVLVLTLGTGIGSALFTDGRLVPNTELGHLEFEGAGAETTVSPSARKRLGEEWDQWHHRMHRYLDHLESLFSPDLIIAAGGVSKRPELMEPLEGRGNLVRAALANNAGIVGAALLGAQDP